LRPLFSNEHIWCQMFSEPGAGSDVASLAMRAERDGDEWIVNGQKVWTTLAHISSYGLVIARTDPELAAHQTRVADLSLEIAREMGLGEKRCMEIHAGALLHDVGRILLPTPAIDATDTSSDKFDLVRRHPLDGWRMLANADLPESVKSIVLWHHERCDGSGYPDRLKRDEIPLEARIVAVADAFETWLFSAPSGPCGRALNHSVASNELSRKAGIHYDLTASMVCLWLFNVRGYRFCSSIS